MVYNKIQVAFGALKKITGPSLEWQYNEKQILVITGLDLPEYYAVDFCNEGDADTITMTASASGVEIPDQFLLTGKKLIAYIVVVDGESVNTVGQITFPVNARSRRTDISPTPAEQQQIDELVNLLNNAAVKAIPEGGLAGQVLSKKTDDDYDTEWADQSGGGGGTTNYNRLTNKPQINGVELAGNKSASDLNIDAGGISFDPEEGYDEGTVGAEVSNQKNAIDANEESIADTQSMIATVEATATASKNYAVGDLLVYDGKLYEVTVNITAASTESQIGSATDARINASMGLVHAEVADSAQQSSDWTVTTYDTAPQVRVVGTALAGTTVNLIFAPMNHGV